MNATTTRKPRTPKMHIRSAAVLVRPSEGQPNTLIRLIVDGEAFHYWLSAMPSDFGRGFYLEKPGHEGPESYEVELTPGVDTCTCKGWTYRQRCKHASSLRALVNAGKL